MDKIEFGKKLIAGLRSMNAFEICNALEKLVRKPRGYGCKTKKLDFHAAVIIANSWFCPHRDGKGCPS